MSISRTSQQNSVDNSEVPSRHAPARLAILAAAMGVWTAMLMTATPAADNAATEELRSKAFHAEATGDHKKAYRYYTQAVEQDPGDPENWKRLGAWQEYRSLWKAAAVTYGKMLVTATARRTRKPHLTPPSG
jgi:hypothetical protein